MNYNEWLNEWLIIWVKPMVKDRTFEKYKNTVRLQISPQLGSCALEELTAPTLQKFTAELVTRYAPNTVTGIIAVVKSSLLCAQSAGVISRQFSDCIKTPRAGTGYRLLYLRGTKAHRKIGRASCRERV